jgi:FkbM family methyltransferase
MVNKALDLALVQNGRELRIRFEFDLSLYSHQILHSFLEQGKFYEAGASSMLGRVLRPGDQFIDVGAHIGYFTMLASALVGPTGCVYAFEPDHDNFTRLLHHIQLNHMENIIPISCAAALQTGLRELYADGNDGGFAIWDLSTLASFRAPQPGAFVARRRIFAAALDDLFRNPAPNTIRAMKIDVEGAELEVLRGAGRLLAIAQIPVIICECHRERLQGAGTSEAALRNFMASLGYDAYADNHLSTALVKLEPGTTLKTNHIFNIIFAKPELQGLMVATAPGPAPAP